MFEVTYFKGEGRDYNAESLLIMNVYIQCRSSLFSSVTSTL